MKSLMIALVVLLAVASMASAQDDTLMIGAAVINPGGDSAQIPVYLCLSQPYCFADIRFVLGGLAGKITPVGITKGTSKGWEFGIGAIDPVAGEVSIICENPDFNQKGRQHIFNLAVALVGASGQVSVKSGKQQCRLGYCDGQGGVTPVFIPAVLKIMSFAPGDANNSGALNGVDVIYLINYLRGKGPEIAGQVLGDADGNCQVNGLDIIYLIRYFEGRGPAPILGGCR